MSLGETIDAIWEEHKKSSGWSGHVSLECNLCSALIRIQKAYEEMVQNLNVLSGPTGIAPPIGETYESVLPRDPDFEKEEAA